LALIVSRYDFTEGDLSFSLKQLKNMLALESEAIPFKIIRFLYTEMGYGGRLVDEQDHRIVRSLGERFLCPNVLEDNHSFSPSGTTSFPMLQAKCTSDSAVTAWVLLTK
jgi:dynein heavy chain, axonemal